MNKTFSGDPRAPLPHQHRKGKGAGWRPDRIDSRIDALRIVACSAALMFLAACGRSSAPDSAMVVTTADSSGWSHARLDAARLEVAYPADRVRAAVSHWTRECDSVPQFQSWNRYTDTLVVFAAPPDIEAVARAAGFVRDAAYPEGFMTTDSALRQTSANLSELGAWKVVQSVVSTRVMFDDGKPSYVDPRTGEGRSDGDQVTQSRFVALSSSSRGCSVGLIWTGGALRESQHGIDAAIWPDTLLSRFFERAIVRQP